jgi:hypothetical protein
MRATLGALLAAVLVTAAFVSCADEGDDPALPPAVDAATPGVDAAVEAAPDAGGAASRPPCAPADPTCTSTLLPCSATDFCPVDTKAVAKELPQYALNAVWGTGAANVYVAGAAGTIVRWDGAKLTLEKPLTTYTLNAVWGSGPDDVWAASTPSVILHRTAAGWAKAPPAETNAFRVHSVVLRAAWGPPDGSAIFLGGDRLTKVSGEDPETQLWRSTTSKVAWASASEIPFFTIQGIWGATANDYWIVGYHFQSGVVAYHVVPSSDPKAPAWVATDLQTVATMNAVWGSSATDVWAVGQHGTIRRHTGGAAARWDVVASPTTEDLRAVWGSSASDVWAAGDGGTLLHWNGTAWRRLVASFPVGKNPDLYGIWGSGGSDVWAVGASGTILRSSGVRTKDPGGAP